MKVEGPALVKPKPSSSTGARPFYLSIAEIESKFLVGEASSRDSAGRRCLVSDDALDAGYPGRAGRVALPTALFSGTERLIASGYFRAKLAQENLIKASPIPYTIVRATQFFEFVGGIAQEATKGQTVRVPSAMMQPIVSEDVAAVVAKVALEEPVSGMVETAGPDPIRQDELVRQYLQATGDPRTVVTDPNALYYNIALNDQSLTPGDNPILGPTHFKDWLAKQPKQSGAVPA